jgi:SAM-dependent methyltransferase
MSSSWWQAFFDHADSLVLSRFPSATETRDQVAALQRLVPLRPEDRIADICCGMGRHLLPLLALGHDLVGLDFAPMMLRKAQAAWAASPPPLTPTHPLRLVQGDARSLPFAAGAFDVVLNLFNSFGYLATDEANQQVLNEAARCLKPGGRFFLDTRNKTHQIIYAPYHEVMRVGRQEYVMRCRYDRKGQRLESNWYDGEDQSRLVHHASIRLYGPDELATMLDTAGFDLIARYGGYDGEEFEGWERELLLLCHKRG